MRTYNMHEAKTHLSRLVRKAVEGEPFIIARAGKRLVRVSCGGRRGGRGPSAAWAFSPDTSPCHPISIAWAGRRSGHRSRGDHDVSARHPSSALCRGHARAASERRAHDSGGSRVGARVQRRIPLGGRDQERAGTPGLPRRSAAAATGPARERVHGAARFRRSRRGGGSAAPGQQRSLRPAAGGAGSDRGTDAAYARSRS